MFFCDRPHASLATTIFRAPPGHPWLVRAVQTVGENYRLHKYGTDAYWPTGPGAFGVAARVDGCCRFSSTALEEKQVGHSTVQRPDDPEEARPTSTAAQHKRGHRELPDSMIVRESSSSGEQGAVAWSLAPASPFTPGAGGGPFAPPAIGYFVNDGDTNGGFAMSPECCGVVPFVLYKYTLFVPYAAKPFADNAYHSAWSKRIAYGELKGERKDGGKEER